MRDEPVYMIGIAAKLAGVHPQTLRIYERKKLICPRRTAGATRLYSQRDIDRLRTIQRLTQEVGLNLAGVEKFLELTDELEKAKSAIENLEAELERAKAKIESLLERSTRRYDLVALPKAEIAVRRMVSSILEPRVALSGHKPNQSGEKT